MIRRSTVVTDDQDGLNSRMEQLDLSTSYEGSNAAGVTLDVAQHIDALTTRADAMRFTGGADGLSLAAEALSLARAAGYRHGEARALRAGAACRSRLLDLDGALQDATAACAIFDRLGETTERAATLTVLGRVHQSLGDCYEAARFYLTALELQCEFGDKAGEAETRCALGGVHAVAGEIAPALEQYRASTDLFEELGNNQGISWTVHNIGSALGALGQDDEALHFHERALADYLSRGETLNAALAQSNVGFAYARLGNPDVALKHYDAGLQLARQAGHADAEVEILENIALLRRDAGNFKGALSILQEVHATSEARHLGGHHAEAHLQIGETLARIGQHDAALTSLMEALAVNRAGGSRQQRADIHRALFTVYETLGQGEPALRHFKEYHTLHEELRGADAERRVLSAMVQMELREKEREAKFLRERNAQLDAANAEKSQLVRQLEAQAIQLERRSREDALTGLRNRRDLDERLPIEWERSRRFGHPLTIALADLDRFKSINDEFSHAIGDQVLRTVAKIFHERTRRVDVVARYGGEEIALLFVETTLIDARGVCDDICAAIERYDWATIATGLRVTISIGLADGMAGDNAWAALEKADGKLYEAKGAGRNRVMG